MKEKPDSIGIILCIRSRNKSKRENSPLSGFMDTLESISIN
ncbi:562_t:CDS:2 [Entrophospora sp. SA101]|nr:562_t:CDS:2 [Entrophospora sp. SA101]